MDIQQTDVKLEANQPTDSAKSLSTQLAELSKQLPSLALLAATFLSSVADPSSGIGISHQK